MAFREYTMSKNPISNRLTPHQETAIDLILAGKSDNEVAEKIGKSRSTVNVWRHHNPLFMATLNDRRQQMWGGQLSRLNTLASEAVDVLQEGLHDEDIKVRLLAAIHILKATGTYGAALPGTQETDPAELAASLYKREKDRGSMVSVGSRSWGSDEMEYDTRAEQQHAFFSAERDRLVSEEIAENSRHVKAEQDKEKLADWDRILPAFADLPPELFDDMEEAALKTLILDFIDARDAYLQTLKEDFAYTMNPDRPVWEDFAYTMNPDRPVWADHAENLDPQVKMQMDGAEYAANAGLQVLLDAWERRGNASDALLNPKRKRRRNPEKNPLMQPDSFRLPGQRDSDSRALPAPEEGGT